jgi:hypothetical protein
MMRVNTDGASYREYFKSISYTSKQYDRNYTMHTSKKFSIIFKLSGDRRA